jgi:hypothetical protein
MAYINDNLTFIDRNIYNVCMIIGNETSQTQYKWKS